MLPESSEPLDISDMMTESVYIPVASAENCGDFIGNDEVDSTRPSLGLCQDLKNNFGALELQAVPIFICELLLAFGETVSLT